MAAAQALTFPGLVVSCQARDNNPMAGAESMLRMAQAAHMGGADGIRACGTNDVRLIKNNLALPMVGLIKKDLPGFEAYITPDLECVTAVLEAGADYVAIDATDQTRPVDLKTLFALVHAHKRLVFADCATAEEALRAETLGADVVSTTMAGYTPNTSAKKTDGPDFATLAATRKLVRVPVVAEGRFWTPQDLQRAFALGADAVVVGTAITNPLEITRRFAAALPQRP